MLSGCELLVIPVDISKLSMAMAAHRLPPNAVWPAGRFCVRNEALIGVASLNGKIYLLTDPRGMLTHVSAWFPAPVFGQTPVGVMHR